MSEQSVIPRVDVVDDIVLLDLVEKLGEVAKGLSDRIGKLEARSNDLAAATNAHGEHIESLRRAANELLEAAGLKIERRAPAAGGVN
jgi:hypothetical protein